jgi:hypothetical protein
MPGFCFTFFGGHGIIDVVSPARIRTATGYISPGGVFLLFYNQHNEKDKRNGLASFVFFAFIREGSICVSGV